MARPKRTPPPRPRTPAPLSGTAQPLPLYVRALHARLRAQLGPGACLAEKVDHPEHGHSEIFVCAEDRPDLLVRVASVLASHSVNIVGAQLFPQSDGTVLDAFQVTHRGRELSEASLWTALLAGLQRAVAGEAEVETLLARAEAGRGAPRRSSDPAGRLPARVFLENRASSRHTTLEIYGRDRVGLLSEIFHVLAQRRVRVADAKILTVGGRVADLFFVTDRNGRKIRNPRTLRALRAHLLSAVRS